MASCAVPCNWNGHKGGRVLQGRAVCTCSASGLQQGSIRAERLPERLDWKSATPRPQSVMKAVRIAWLLANSVSMPLVPQRLIWTGATSSGSAAGILCQSSHAADFVTRDHMRPMEMCNEKGCAAEGRSNNYLQAPPLRHLCPRRAGRTPQGRSDETSWPRPGIQARKRNVCLTAGVALKAAWPHSSYQISFDFQLHRRISLCVQKLHIVRRGVKSCLTFEVSASDAGASFKESQLHFNIT